MEDYLVLYNNFRPLIDFTLKAGLFSYLYASTQIYLSLIHI